MTAPPFFLIFSASIQFPSPKEGWNYKNMAAFSLSAHRNSPLVPPVNYFDSAVLIGKSSVRNAS
jgi:hypothetical protein